MVHNRTCGCPSCFEINYPDRINPHRTHGFRTPTKTLQPSISGSSYAPSREAFDWVRRDNITFFTECWWCGEPVYFHRNKNGGCVLFDALTTPWPVHACWEEHKHNHVAATNDLVERRIKQLESIRIKDFLLSEKDVSQKSLLEGFILGCDTDQRVLPDPNRMSDKTSFLRYMLFRTIEGEHIKILVPERSIEDIVKYSFVAIHVEYHLRKSSILIHCLREIEVNSMDSSDRSKFTTDYEYKQIADLRWILQEGLTK